MISELILKNFRGFENHCINFRELTVVVGANNAGKSTIVEALRLVSIVATRYRNLSYIKPPGWLDEYGAHVGIKVPLGNLEINFDNIFYHYGNPPASITAKFINGCKIQIFLGNDGMCFSSISDYNGHPIISQARARSTNIPPVSIMPQIGPLRSVEDVLSEEYVKRVASSNLASLHFRNQLKVFTELLPQLELAVSETWPGVQIEELILPGLLAPQTIYLEIRNEDYVGEVGTMGHGLQMWLQTIWFLCRAQANGTVILDEPDVYMHADMQRRLIRYIRGRFPQIIITTHSVEIMAEVEPENILVVDRRRLKSQFTSNTPAVQSFLERIGSAQNLHLARLWSSRRLVLVEGKDIKYLKILQNKLFPDSQCPIDSIPNMSIGGWGGWSYAIGSDMLMKNAVGDQIITYCIFDSDYHTPEEISQRFQQAQGRGVCLHIWSKKEIENFFLIPAAIQRFISQKASRRTNTPSQEEVLNQINSIADEMEDLTFDALSFECLCNDRSGGNPKANQRARAKIKETRLKSSSLVDIVSGKDLITKLSDWAQTEFGVSFSPMTLLRELQKEEISDELKNVLEAIEYSRHFHARR